MDEPEFASEVGDEVRIALKVTPKSRRLGFAGVAGGALRVHVHEAPEDGRATEAVLRLVADALSVRRSDVVLRAGATSPKKVVAVRGTSLAAVKALADDQRK